MTFFLEEDGLFNQMMTGIAEVCCIEHLDPHSQCLNVVQNHPYMSLALFVLSAANKGHQSLDIPIGADI